MRQTLGGKICPACAIYRMSHFYHIHTSNLSKMKKKLRFWNLELWWMQMFAELQMLTPMVPTREVYFVRFCKQISAEQWAIVDVSIDKVEETIDASLVKCRKRPSGCIIEDKSNGHCKVQSSFTYFHWNPSFTWENKNKKLCGIEIGLGGDSRGEINGVIHWFVLCDED